MPNTMTLISAVTLSSNSGSIDFTSIPQTYTDLILKCSLRNDTANYSDNIKIVVNGNASSIYTSKLLYSNSSGSAFSATQSGTIASFQYGTGSTATASTFGNAEFYFPNYTSSNYKAWSYDGVTENNATNSFQALTSGLWSSTAAITSLSLICENTAKLLQTNSTAYLYGIKNS